MKRKAFTLVEMLVVISIIAVLMGMLIPVVGRVREFARSAQCMANLKQLHQAVVNFANDNGGYMPYSASREAQDENLRWYQAETGWVNWLAVPYSSGGNKRTYWYSANGTACITNGSLYAYAKDERIYLCPTFSRSAVCGRSDPVRNYVMNRSVSGSEISMRAAPRTILFADGGLHRYPVKGSSANQTAYAGLRGADNANWNNFETVIGNWNYLGKHYMQLDGELRGNKNGANNWPEECIGTYHNGRGNVVFVDGHCEKLPLGNGNIRYDTTNAVAGNWGN